MKEIKQKKVTRKTRNKIIAYKRFVEIKARYLIFVSVLHNELKKVLKNIYNPFVRDAK